MVGFHKAIYLSVAICIKSEATCIWLPSLSSFVICLMCYCIKLPVTNDVVRFNAISWVDTISLSTAVIEYLTVLLEYINLF